MLSTPIVLVASVTSVASFLAVTENFGGCVYTASVRMHRQGFISNLNRDTPNPLQHASQGVRVSDPATVDIAEMVLCGSINKGIASSIKRAGGRAVGLSGKDDNLLLAKKLGKKIVDEATGEVKVMLSNPKRTAMNTITRQYKYSTKKS